MVIPVFPLYAKSFGVGLAAIGLVQLVFGLTRFSFGLVGGLVVDRFGGEHHELSGYAKDVASAAVFVSLINAAVVWGLVLFF